MIDLIEICTKVLVRLSKIDYERDGGNSFEQLIFPLKIQAQGTKLKDRVSEQELRLLFIEEFKKAHKDLFYSIETPTVEKYKFGNGYESIKTTLEGQSASLDMCIFRRNSNKYVRLLNIEFKHKNIPLNKIGKDILKLLHESQDGAFIHLLDNTDIGTLQNKNGTGIFDKLYKSFTDFRNNWKGEHKSIYLIILSLKQRVLIQRIIKKSDLDNLREIFYIDTDCGNMERMTEDIWKKEQIN